MRIHFFTAPFSVPSYFLAAFLALVFLAGFTLTFSFSCLETRKAGVLEAGILMTSCVDGLWPSRALRSRTSKVPKPIS